MSKISFIGRRSELKTINQSIRLWKPDSVAVFFQGEGGVGKTRLLQQTQQSFKNDGNIFVGQIVDFDDPALQRPENIGLHIANLFDSKVFRGYRNKLEDYQKIMNASVAQEMLDEQIVKVQHAFAEDFNRFTMSKRVVLLFDTLDLPKDVNDDANHQDRTEIFKYLTKFLSNISLRNAVFVFVGRSTKELYIKFEESWGKRSRFYSLKPFSMAEMEEYIDRKANLLAVPVPSDWKQKVAYLSNGKPIMIDLAVDALSKGEPLEWVNEIDAENTKSAPSRVVHQKEFEERLVSHLVAGGESIHMLTRAMAEIYPLNTEMIAKLLRIDMDETEPIFNKLKLRAYIKALPDGRITLHDEMRRMLRGYLINQNNPDDTYFLQRNSRYIATYFNQEIERIDKTIEMLDALENSTYPTLEDLRGDRQQFVLNEIRYTLYDNVSSGFALYLKHIWVARRKGSVGFAEYIQKIIIPYASKLVLWQRFEVQILKGRLLNDRGKFNNAKSLFLQLLIEMNDGDQRLVAEVRNGLAVSEVGLGELDLALEHQESVLGYLESIGDTQELPYVANYRGHIQRLYGRWQDAIDSYKYAFVIETSQVNPRPALIAGILIRRGYAHSIGGDFASGRKYCEEAIKIAKKVQSDKHIVRGQISLATIYRGLGKHEEAIKLLKLTIHRLKEPDDYQNLINAYFHLAWTQWFKGVAENDVEELKLSQKNYKKSYDLAEEYHSQVGKPGILHQYSAICWELGERDKARELNKASYKLSLEMNDIRYQIDSLVGEAEYDYDEGIFDRIPQYAELLKKEYEDKGYRYELFYGRTRRIVADVFFEQGKKQQALENYMECIILIKQHGGYKNIYSKDKELVRIQKRMDALSEEDALHWIQYLQSHWEVLEPKERYIDLMAWCDEQLTDIRLRKVLNN